MSWIDAFKTKEGHNLPPNVGRAFVLLGRAGYASRGLIYLAVGILAGLAAIGAAHGETTDATGAVARLDDLPFGAVLVALASAGLFGYALWRIVQAVFNLERFKGPRNGLWWRILFIVDGLVHAVFGYTVWSVTFGQGGGDGEEEAKDWTASVLAQPYGAWLVGLGGVLALLGGGYLFFRVCTARYGRQLQDAVEDKWQSKAVIATARAGEAARGVVFAIVGIFVLRAAWLHDPDETRSLGGAMHALAEQPFGRVWLGLIALGFVAYGAFSLLECRYRKIGLGRAGGGSG